MKRREIRDMSEEYLRKGGTKLTAEERKVIEKVVKAAKLEWFSFVEGTNEKNKNKKSVCSYAFDRVFEANTKRFMSITDALKRIEDEISKKTLDCLDEHEKDVYASLYERSFIMSKYLKPKYNGIFRNKGLWRRIARWSAMDELVEAMVNEDAKRLWNAEGYPMGVLDMGLVNIPNLKWFRESIDKPSLTEEEFDRISEVFKKCINM